MKMKKRGYLYKWIILSVLAQVIILFYLNSMFSSEKKVHVVATDINSAIEVPSQPIEVPDDANEIDVSYDLSYLSYLQGGNLIIMDTKDKKVQKTISVDSVNVDFYKWLPDRNIVIYSMRPKRSDPNSIQISTYDVVSGNQKDYSKITKNLNKESKVNDIDVSALTNVVYAQIKMAKNKAQVYRFDIMGHMKSVLTTNEDTLIQETNYSDNLIYQNCTDKIYVRNGIKNTTNTLKYGGNVKLLGVDSDDLIYVAKVDINNNVGTILYGKVDTPCPSSWEKLQIKNVIEFNNIYITQEGEIYGNNSEKEFIFDVKSDKKMNYKGQLISIKSGHIITKNGNKVTLSEIKL